jgi:hypothetical protein
MEITEFTKAGALLHLYQQAKGIRVEKPYVYTVEAWRREPERIVREITEALAPGKVVVRSSALHEDGGESSMAGYFISILDVDASKVRDVGQAIAKVVDSYRRGRDEDGNQILIQRQVSDVKCSGVIFTRQIGTNAPYYVINFDDETGRSDTVTGGRNSSLAVISRFVKKPFEGRWKGLLTAVQRIEEIFDGGPLDIEFAVTGDDQVVIFQVRALAANRNVPMPDDRRVQKLIEDVKGKFLRFSRRVPHLCGNYTIYGDMPDWNPAEIIGDRPNSLDYSLYRSIITNNVWHQARTSLGYVDVFPGELMTSFARKPYIDVRLSFNSMVPRGIALPLREKLLGYYLDYLYHNPHLQDKVEFDVLWTCYDLSVERKLEVLRRHGFTQQEVKSIARELKKMTVGVLAGAEKTFKADLAALETLAHRRIQAVAGLRTGEDSVWDILGAVHYILQNCRRYGTFPFSRLARMAFIANSLLISLREAGILGEASHEALLLSVNTVAKDFSKDLERMSDGSLGTYHFFSVYGHLRAGTYDITSPRYDRQAAQFALPGGGPRDAREKRKKPFSLAPKEARALDKALRESGLGVDSRQLIDFIVKAIEYRELSKFEFTKALSESIELLARAGELMGMERHELAHSDIETLLSFRNPEIPDLAYVRARIKNTVARRRSEKELFDMVLLPPVIRSVRDFDYLEFHTQSPNFITEKKVKGPYFPVTKGQGVKDSRIKGKIVLVENADPGYDWIFTEQPAGLVTKYGGVASHMAIRCAEFGLPAAIGCGEVIFANILKSREILIDCKRHKIECMG